MTLEQQKAELEKQLEEVNRQLAQQSDPCKVKVGEVGYYGWVTLGGEIELEGAVRRDGEFFLYPDDQEALDVAARMAMVAMPKAWMPERLGAYWFIDRDGDVSRDSWWGMTSDWLLYHSGNCFKTKEQAEANIEKFKVWWKA